MNFLETGRKILNRYYLPAFLVIIYLVGLTVYSNSFKGEFVFDDFTSVVSQENINKLTDIPTIWNSHKTRFIPFLTYAVNYRFNNFDPWGYHLVNFTIHIFNAFLLFFTVRIIQRIPVFRNNLLAKSKLLPFIAALIFTVHPVQTQAVNFISQRSALITFFFYLITIYFYLQSKMAKVKTSKLIYFAIALTSSLLAFVSKENSYTLPLAIILTDYLFFFKKNLKNKIEFLKPLPFFLLSFIVYYLIYLKGGGPVFDKISSINMLFDKKISGWEYLLTQFRVIVTYIRLLLFPVNLNVDYDFPISKSIWELPVILSLNIIIFLVLISLFFLKRNRFITFGVLFFLIALLVESSVIPINDVIFEHRLYLPSAGFFIAVSSIIIFIKNFVESKKIKQIYFYFPVILLIISFSFLTFKRNYIWQSEYALWKDVAGKSPNKARPHYNLGVASYSTGKITEAKNEFQKTIALDPQYLDAYRNLGYIFESEKKYDEALSLYNQGLKVNFYDTTIRAQIASFYTSRKKYEEAIDQYLKILEYDPRNSKVYNDMGIVYFIQNKQEETLASFKKAVDHDPKYKTAILNLANSFFHYGFNEKALEYYLLLLKLDPDNIQALYNCGLIYYENKNYPQAGKYFQKTSKLDANFSEVRKLLKEIEYK
ncbi:hypothetical protein A2W14_03145 [Candidatus Gottesmanbacteria bacterium RBG_16_37_8]|uniref:Uncharacterized protein n=1 Tax=Candidatus Gottesmanbacteria bacterium RBG_16_37_8 TaxID=1798371 RepID=A0A1F5YU05_9BACT|nr:MAG: hypothetical protein A2W14_03145 [Candidatus Gottesmanbacteria bacterium RBG_16_37_8]